MSIRPVVLNGMIQNTQDVGNLKQQEDNKPLIQQQNLSIQQEKQEEKQARQVQQPEQKENEGYRYDAKEKGNNSYDGNQKRKKRQHEEDGEQNTDGKVILKSHGSSFDIKI